MLSLKKRKEPAEKDAAYARIRTKKHKLPDNDVADNILTAIKSAVYMNYRNLYNNKKLPSATPSCIAPCFSLYGIMLIAVCSDIVKRENSMFRMVV